MNLREIFVTKELARFRRQAEVSLSIIKLYNHVICAESATLDLLEM